MESMFSRFFVIVKVVFITFSFYIPMLMHICFRKNSSRENGFREKKSYIKNTFNSRTKCVWSKCCYRMTVATAATKWIFHNNLSRAHFYPSGHVNKHKFAILGVGDGKSRVHEKSWSDLFFMEPTVTPFQLMVTAFKPCCLIIYLKLTTWIWICGSTCHSLSHCV